MNPLTIAVWITAAGMAGLLVAYFWPRKKPVSLLALHIASVNGGL